MKPTVLSVDDCPLTQKVIRKLLQPTYRVLSVGDAKSALEVIYNDYIDVLLLDVTMPEIDGLELCRTIRNLPQFPNIPIVMLTSRDGVFDRIQGKIAGATEYLTKPFNAEELAQTIDKVLHRVAHEA